MNIYKQLANNEVIVLKQYYIFTTKIFRIILNGKFYRQYQDKNNSLGFHLAVDEEQFNQAREKNIWKKVRK